MCELRLQALQPHPPCWGRGAAPDHDLMDDDQGHVALYGVLVARPRDPVDFADRVVDKQAGHGRSH
jgi:hypothetical protein